MYTPDTCRLTSLHQVWLTWTQLCEQNVLWLNHTSKTVLTLEEFVSWVDSSDFYSSNTLLCSNTYPQTTLPILSACYSCPCKALIQLQKDFSSFLWPALPHFQEALWAYQPLIFSSAIPTHTQSPQQLCFKPHEAKNPQPLLDHRSQEYTKTHSTTTRDVSGEQDTVPRNAEQGAFVLTAKWL